jgi:hypothetical protein
MISETTRQQRGVLLVALLGFTRINPSYKPTRKRILAFIRNKKLIAWNEHEIEWSDANCTVGENRISWRCKDFVHDGFLKEGPSSPTQIDWHLQAPGRTEYGIWELTDQGIKKVENVVREWRERFEGNPKFFEELKNRVPELKLTDEFMNLVLQLAHKDFNTKFYPTK